MSDTFFNDKQPDTKPEGGVSETIKVGDEEYTQEELNRLISQGKTVSELESKWNTKIDRLMPEYTKTTQELAELKKEKEERTRETEERIKSKPTEDLSPEELRTRARQEARALGLVLEEDLENYYQQRRNGEVLLQQAEQVVAEAKKDGKPGVETEELLQYMADNGIKDPSKAYKLMKEDELDKWKEEKLKSLKPAPMHTQSGTNAGSKLPPETRITKQNLAEMVRATIGRNG